MVFAFLLQVVPHLLIHFQNLALGFGESFMILLCSSAVKPLLKFFSRKDKIDCGGSQSSSDSTVGSNSTVGLNSTSSRASASVAQ